MVAKGLVFARQLLVEADGDGKRPFCPPPGYLISRRPPGHGAGGAAGLPGERRTAVALRLHLRPDRLEELRLGPRARAERRLHRHPAGASGAETEASIMSPPPGPA